MYEPAKHRALDQVLRPGMTFLDVGACKGDFTVFAAVRVGPLGRVVAIEPEPANVRSLRMSIARNRVHNAEVHEMALSDASGRGILHRIDVSAAIGGSSGWHSLLAGGAGERQELEIEIRTLDELLAHLGILHVDVLKIDVEGWEVPVLRGARHTLGEIHPILLMDLHPDLGVNPGTIAEILHDHHYETFHMDAPAEPLEVRRDTVEILARPRPRDDVRVHDRSTLR
ncbi:MAG TPA: FkbM family methyltransferase [Solirubrobacteraceae bacterium]